MAFLSAYPVGNRLFWIPKEEAEQYDQELKACFAYIDRHHPDLCKYRGETSESLHALHLPFSTEITHLAIDALLTMVNAPECLFGPHPQSCRCDRCTEFLQVSNQVIELIHNNLRQWHKEDGYHSEYAIHKKENEEGDIEDGEEEEFVHY